MDNYGNKSKPHFFLKIQKKKLLKSETKKKSICSESSVINPLMHTQPEFTCSKLTIETLEQGVKYVQS